MLTLKELGLLIACFISLPRLNKPKHPIMRTKSVSIILWIFGQSPKPFYIPADLGKQHWCHQQDDWINTSAADHYYHSLLEMHACFLLLLFFTINQLEGYIAAIGSLSGRMTKGNLKVVFEHSSADSVSRHYQPLPFWGYNEIWSFKVKGILKERGCFVWINVRVWDERQQIASSKYIV